MTDQRGRQAEKPSATAIVAALGGRWQENKSFALCRCPAHEDRCPSLSVRQGRDGSVLLKCFAQCTYQEIVAELIRRKLWPDPKDAQQREPPAPLHPPVRFCGITVAETMEGRQRAQRIWDQTRPAGKTLVEEYLRARGIRLPMSDQLRFHPRLWHTNSQRFFPAMVARGSDDRGFTFIHRTYLDGPRKADVIANKKCLGFMGEGAVRLRMPVTDTLGLGEGIETALSASQLYSYAVWAVCGVRFDKIEIPETIVNIVIFGDSGDAGRIAAFKAADIFERRGLHVQVIFPAAHYTADSSDFNDVVQSGAR